MADNYEHLQLGHGDAVATVHLARSDVRNALNAGLIEELRLCMEELAQDDSTRLVVLTGEGDFFCAGADIEYMKDTANFSYEENLEDARRIAAMFRAVDECSKPVVARVKGAAIGGGVGLVAAVDVAVAEEGTVFAFSEVRLGIPPATIAPFVVRKIGHSQARALLLTGERFEAARAREIGLVHEVAAEDDLEAVVQQKVADLLTGGPEALAVTKGLLRKLQNVAPAETTEIMAQHIAELRTGDEGQEGLGAFLDKREPAWRSEETS